MCNKSGRKPFIAGNWKMNLNRRSAMDLVKTIKSRLGDGDDREVAVFPSFVYLADIVAVAQGTPLGVGAQNLWHEKEGAFTGEISPGMLKDIGVNRVLVGHSERRHVFGEKNEVMGPKMAAALAASILPVYCVGETLEERKRGTTEQVVRRQLLAGLEEVDPAQMSRVVIAYEPVWAIGTGETATPAQAGEVHHYLRLQIEQKYGNEVAEKLRILYGGSVKPGNVKELMAVPDIDGVLVGGASLKPDQFLPILEYDK